MVNGVESTTSILQIARAQQAFKNAAKYSPNSVEDNSNDDSAVNVSLNNDYNLSSLNQKDSLNPITPTLSQKTQYINDVKDFASQNGLSDINDNDISYAMKYGRSILVDQSA